MNDKRHYLLAIILILFLSGCTLLGQSSKKATEEEPAKPPETSELSGKVKVAYLLNADQFMRDYGKLLQTKYPQVTFEVIPLPSLRQADYESTLKKLIEENEVDLVYPLTSFQYLAANNELYELNPLIKRDNFDLSHLYPPVIGKLQQLGGDIKLYGLAPTFLMKGLYYNKDLFDKYAVPYPKDNMTWMDVLALSRTFNAKAAADHVVGLSIGDPSLYQLVRNIANSEGLSEFDASGRFAISTKEWMSLWDFVVEQIRSRNIVMEGEKQIGATLEQTVNAFRQGSSAMTISNNVMVRELFQAGASFDWAVVTEPVNKNFPGESDSFVLTDVFSIYAKSKQVDLAWELLKFLHSDDGTALLQQQNNYVLTSHTPYVKEVRGRDVNAFYKLQLKKTIPDRVPPSFYAQLDAPSTAEIADMVKGNKSIADAIQALEKKGNEILQAFAAK